MRARKTPAPKRHPKRAAEDAPRLRIAGPEDYAAVFASVADGKSLRQACKGVGLNRGSLWRAIQADEALRSQYARAREWQGEAHQERITEVAQELEAGVPPERVQALRTALDARKWAASKLAPALYGDTPPRGETTVNIGELHLAALRELGQRDRLALPAARVAEDADTDGGRDAD